MRNFFETKKVDNADQQGKESQSAQETEIVENKAEGFLAENERVISDYAQNGGLVFRRGKGWAIRMETGEATYDPKFFSDKGYSNAESMWATCHEVEHFRDWRKDPETYAKLFGRMKTRRRIHLLYNCLDDIMVNRNVDKRFPAHQETKKYLYQEKLFPGTDYFDKPKHLQFAYAALREKMLPEELMTLDPEVRKEIENLKNIDGKGTDLINIVSNPEAKPKDRFSLIEEYIEPIYEKFFQEDVEKRRAQEEKEKGEGEKGEEGEESGEPADAEAKAGEEGKKVKPKKTTPAEDYFADNYDDFDDKSPKALPDKDIKDELDKFIKQKKEDEKSPEEIAKEQFKKQHGVTYEDMQRYRQNYEKIKDYIEPLREIFARIISTRKEIKRRLKERTDQGVIMDPSLISQAYIDAKSGVMDSRTQLKVKKIEYDEHKPNDFEFSLVCDLSGSMSENSPGGKSYEQRLCAILIMEALDEFEEKLKSEREDKTLDLHVLTEVRGFGEGDEELKPLGDTIEYKFRVGMNKRLSNCDGGSTKDYKSLAKISESVSDEIKLKIEKNELKKVVLLITDGGSDDVDRAKVEKNALSGAGVIIKAIQIGQVGAEDKAKFARVWQKPEKDGYACKDVSQLVATVEKLLEEFLEEL